MKTLVVIAEHPAAASELRGPLSPDQWRIVHRATLNEAEPILAGGLADACVLDLALTSTPAAWTLQKFRRLAPATPLIVYAGQPRPDWEEEAYNLGATHVLLKPIKPGIVAHIVDRFTGAVAKPMENVESLGLAQQQKSAGTSDTTLISRPGPAQEMAVLRNFSGILKHSLDVEGMAREFFLLLRKILGFNRGAIFLICPTTVEHTGAPRLRAMCGTGLSQGLLEHLDLSLESGIGAMLVRTGRILRRSSEEAALNAEIQKEFELLRAQIAVPILDRENVLGVAIFDGRITGEPLSNAELEFVFSLLEQLGLALRNIWLHEQLATNHQMLADILRELSSACVLVRSDLKVLHANKQARKYFQPTERRGVDMEFADLPQVIGSKIYQVLKTGVALANFKYESEEAPGRVYRLNVVPFQGPQPGITASALLLAEDLTQSEQLRKIETEAASLRLIPRMVDRLVPEIANAILPVSAYQQLLATGAHDREFLKSMEVDLGQCITRVNRLLDQMRRLAEPGGLDQQSFPAVSLLQESFQEACKHLPKDVKPIEPKVDAPKKTILLTGNRAALKLAFTELILNALQADKDPKVLVRLDPGNNGSLRIEIQDNGAGFTTDSAAKATSPFFTTRAVGAGLGLTVSRKIIEAHRGNIEIAPTPAGQSGVVKVFLPAAQVPSHQ